MITLPPLNPTHAYPWRFSFFLRFILSTLSGVLLILSYPTFDWSFLAWMALVPLFIVLETTRRWWSGFLWGYWTGLIFFVGTLYWFIHVTLPGMILLMLYLAVYFGLFGMIYTFYRRRSCRWRLFLLPSVWIALECAREHVLTGFGWVALGHSQYKFIPLIQIADMTGVAGISFLVVMVNVIIKEISQQWYWLSRKGTLKENFWTEFHNVQLRRDFLLTMTIVWLVLIYGFYRLEIQNPATQFMKVAVVQTNIPQDLKWAPSAWPIIMEKEFSLTRQVAALSPDLIIWPETSFPGYMWESKALYAKLKEFVAEIKIPLIVGAVDRKVEKYYNSAILIGPDGKEVATYNKIHLVPFGEFIPFRRLFRFLEDIIPIEDFTPGTEATLFPSYSDGRSLPNTKFSVLICFEDTLGRVASIFVRQGAQLLVNITNDAWFMDTKAPFLHLQAAVFRTVENRRSLIRAANTGVSCFIDQFGHIEHMVENSSGKKTFVTAFTVENVGFHSEETFYTKFGEIFTYLCFGCILVGTVLSRQRFI